MRFLAPFELIPTIAFPLFTMTKLDSEGTSNLFLVSEIGVMISLEADFKIVCKENILMGPLSIRKMI